MNKGFKRTDRIAELIQRELAHAIQKEMTDPRLPNLITISLVKISPDLSHAKIYYTIINEAEAPIVSKVLNASAPFLRGLLAKSLSFRIVPQLRFVYDESIADSRRLLRLIDKANEA